MTKLSFALCLCLAIVILNSAQTQVANTACSQLWEVRYNCDYGGVLTPLKIESQVDCGQACVNDPKCTHFTWQRDTNKCYLRQASTEEEVLAHERCDNNKVCGSVPGRIDPPRSCGNGLHTEYGVDCFGLDLPGQPSKGLSEDDCARECQKNSKCTHYTWHVNRDCFLKQASNRQQGMATRQCNPMAVCGIDKSRFSKDKLHRKCNAPTFDFRFGCIFDAPAFKVISSPTLWTVDECGRECIKEARCTHFTLTETPRKCNLHSGGTDEQQILSTHKCSNRNYCGIYNDRLSKTTSTPSGSDTTTCDMPDTELSKNCDFILLHLHPMKEGLTLDECINWCFNENECTHYTYYVPEKKCWVQKGESEAQIMATRVCRQNSFCGLQKDRFPSPPLNCTGSFSALAAYDCNYTGLDLPNNPIYAWSIGECSRSCFRDPRCTHISWLDNSKCYLKQADSKKQAVDTLKCIPGAVCSLIDRRLK